MTNNDFYFVVIIIIMAFILLLLLIYLDNVNFVNVWIIMNSFMRRE